MSMIQIRNVPEDLHRRLKVRAAEEGVTLSELALQELSRSIEFPTPRELNERFGRMKPLEDWGGETAVQAIREMRDSR